ncbi:nicotinate-nucleotide adenylyltransferase [Halomonas binhaiensis]|uniref:Probable nicotinate-nucleotide adenylyltransferase n=1 Tax=Halomonas binhaiensis TaxID=2562282 RepID=A0A5C1NKU1_9GAMM|nr:nicotinate-nucleotide adenylyltransferase [Halomonas binhaiensis]QEM83984.1 nicotinate-nucleotide adenylyltransferase [Halomonas binhaiensis]
MLGGTFDPVHLGHLRTAVELREVLGLHGVHMIPAAQPPLRDQPQVSPEQRLALLRLGIGDTPGVVADPLELERAGPSYSADTLAVLRRRYGNDACLVMALGHDAFLKLAGWHEPERLFELANLVVVDRPDHGSPLPPALRTLLAGREVESVEALMARPYGRLLRLCLPSRMAISATFVRERLARGGSVRYLLAEAVEAEIQAKGLYLQCDCREG